MKKLNYANEYNGSDSMASFHANVDANEAMCLARMLAFAADEARELGADSCHILIAQSLSNLKERFNLKFEDFDAVRLN